jgi:hypothetical protein
MEASKGTQSGDSMNKLNLTANIISIISGVITILGIGGIVSWSLFSKERRPFQQKVAAVLAFALKTGFCLVTLGLLAWPAFLVYGTILAFSAKDVSSSTLFWNSSEPVQYVVAYIVIGLLFLPLYLVLCSTIYEWSFEPFRRLAKAFRKQTG